MDGFAVAEARADLLFAAAEGGDSKWAAQAKAQLERYWPQPEPEPEPEPEPGQQQLQESKPLASAVKIPTPYGKVLKRGTSSRLLSCP